MPYKSDLEVSDFEEVIVIHLLLYRVSHFSFDDLIFDKDLTNGLIVLVEDIHLARQATMMETFHFHLYHSLPETHRFCHIVLREVDFLAIFKADEVQFERTFLFGKREDKGFLPRHILGLG